MNSDAQILHGDHDSCGRCGYEATTLELLTGWAMVEKAISMACDSDAHEQDHADQPRPAADDLEPDHPPLVAPSGCRCLRCGFFINPALHVNIASASADESLTVALLSPAQLVSELLQRRNTWLAQQFEQVFQVHCTGKSCKMHECAHTSAAESLSEARTQHNPSALLRPDDALGTHDLSVYWSVLFAAMVKDRFTADADAPASGVLQGILASPSGVESSFAEFKISEPFSADVVVDDRDLNSRSNMIAVVQSTCPVYGPWRFRLLLSSSGSSGGDPLPTTLHLDPAFVQPPEFSVVSKCTAALRQLLHQGDVESAITAFFTHKHGAASLMDPASVTSVKTYFKQPLYTHLLSANASRAPKPDSVACMTQRWSYGLPHKDVPCTRYDRLTDAILSRRHGTSMELHTSELSSQLLSVHQHTVFFGSVLRALRSLQSQLTPNLTAIPSHSTAISNRKTVSETAPLSTTAAATKLSTGPSNPNAHLPAGSRSTVRTIRRAKPEPEPAVQASNVDVARAAANSSSDAGSLQSVQHLANPVQELMRQEV